MKELMVENALVEVQNNQIVVSSKQVAEHFEKYHKDVLESIREILVAEKSAAKFFVESTFENRGKSYPMYLMNRKGFSLLAMGFTGSKALQWKIKYIEAFDAMEEMLKKQTQEQQPSYLIDDEIERAKRWIEEAQERKQLAETNQRLEQELEQEKEFKNVVFEKEECVSYSDAYKIIASELNHIGRNNFIQALRDKNIISKYNIPRDYYINKGFFKIKKVIIVKTDGDTKERKQGVVTPKGIDWLLQYFKKCVLK